MPRRENAKSLSIQLTPEQDAALTEAANRAKKSRATYIRDLISENIPGFENTIQSRKDMSKAGK